MRNLEIILKACVKTALIIKQIVMRSGLINNQAIWATYREASANKVWMQLKPWPHKIKSIRDTRQDNVSKSLRLFRISRSVLPPTLDRFRTIFRVQNIVPPPETARVIANKLLVMKIMVIRPSPEREEVVKAPRKFVAAVRIDGLEQAKDNPDIHCEYVQMSSYCTPNNGTSNSAKTENHDLNWRRILGGHTEWSGILMMNLMNSLIQWAPMESTVWKVMPRIFHDEENRDLIGHSPDRGKRNWCWKTKKLRHWMEKPAMSR